MNGAGLAISAAAGLAVLGFARGRGSRKLEGFERIGTLPRPSQVHPVSRGIYSPRAEEVYTERLKTARLPLYILLGGGEDPEDRDWKRRLERRAKELAEQGYTVILISMPLEKYVEKIMLSSVHHHLIKNDEERAKVIKQALERAQALLEGRDPSRKISPMTPFTLLHRMGDEMHTLWWSRWLMSETLGPYRKFVETGHGFRSNQELLDIGSAGVNTMAGRNGLLRMPETISDLWAKYVLTGRIDFDPKAPPQTARKRGWTIFEQRVRDETHEKICRIFPQVLELARGKVIEVVP
jgi:hypothetical protein